MKGGLGMLRRLPSLLGRRPATGSIPPSELWERLSQPEPPLVLDVRSPAELAGPLGRIEGAVNVPLDALASRLDEIGEGRARLLVPV